MREMERNHHACTARIGITGIGRGVHTDSSIHTDSSRFTPDEIRKDPLVMHSASRRSAGVLGTIKVENGNSPRTYYTILFQRQRVS